MNVLSPKAAEASALLPKRGSRLQFERRATVWVTRRFDASPGRVFDAWLDPGIAGRWLFATASRAVEPVTLDARVGGAFRFVDDDDGERVEHSGVYVEIDRPWRLVFTLSAGDHAGSRTRVIAEIVPRNEGCELTVSHENVPPQCLSRTENRWTGMLYGLGRMLAS
jgi:uncharacterized protein YndB with AHSA1/START domain